MQALSDVRTLRVTIERQGKLDVDEIADTGTRIPASILPRIFELYFTTKPKGSGIGLAMTYRILQLHGGALDVRSNPHPLAADRGTTFTVRLPLATGAVVDTRKAAAGVGERAVGEHV